MGDSPFFNADSPLATGPTLFLAPSGSLTNFVASPPPSLMRLAVLCKEYVEAGRELKHILDDLLPEASEAFAGALAGMRALAGVARALEETVTYRVVAGIPPGNDLVNRCHDLRAKADALLQAAMDKAGPDVDVRKWVPALDARATAAVEKIVELVRGADHIAVVRAFVEDQDPAITPVMRYIELNQFQAVCAQVIDIAARTERGAREFDTIAQEILRRDDHQSVPAIAIAKGKSLWDAFVQVTAVTTGTVGNLPAPDSLSIVLIKCYAGMRLPRAAMSQSAAQSLEGDIVAFFLSAIKLTDAQSADLKGRLSGLKSAQREVLRTAMRESDISARLKNHKARVDRATRQRTQAEDDCSVKARNVREFYKDTYGPKNDEIFAGLQRGIFMDSFVTVFTMVQFCAAFQELNDPDVSTGQKFADITTTGVLAGAALVATVGKHVGDVDMGIAKLNLASFGKFAESLQRPFAVIAGVMSMVSGVAQIIQGYEDDDPKTMIIGGITVSSGFAITLGAYLGGVGAATAGAVATGIGVGIGVLLAGYLALEFLSDALKSKTQKGVESILDSLANKPVYGGKTAINYLGLESLILGLREVVDAGVCFAFPRNPSGPPTRADLVRRMVDLGFKSDYATGMVESDDDETGRMQPPLMFEFAP